MNINDLLARTNVQIVTTAADLKEFALAILAEVQNGSNKEEETLYTPSEFAARHRVSKPTLWRWCKAGILTPTRMGGKVYYKESSLRKGVEA